MDASNTLTLKYNQYKPNVSLTRPLNVNKIAKAADSGCYLAIGSREERARPRKRQEYKAKPQPIRTQRGASARSPLDGSAIRHSQWGKRRNSSVLLHGMVLYGVHLRLDVMYVVKYVCNTHVSC